MTQHSTLEPDAGNADVGSDLSTPTIRLQIQTPRLIAVEARADPLYLARLLFEKRLGGFTLWGNGEEDGTISGVD